MNERESQAAGAEAAQQYELLLHSICHQQTQLYLERHALLFEKWCRDYEDGLYIRDLKYIIPLLQTFRERYDANPQLFRKAFGQITKLCAKPLLECKANERRNKQSMENIGQFYKEIALMFSTSDARLRVEVGKCLRTIVHGGKDPSVLRADQVDWIGDGTRLQLIDKEFIQSMMRDGGALDIVIEEFLVAVDNFQIGLQEYNSVPPAERNDLMELNHNNSHDNGNNNSPSSRLAKAESEDDFSLSSRPKSPEELRAQYHNNNSSTDINNDGEDGLIINEEDMEALKLEVNNAQGLARVMLDLCMDFAAYDISASYMCKLRVCNGIVKYLSLECDESKDTEPIAVDLLWTVLDCYLTRARIENKFDEYVLDPVMDFEDAIAVLLDIFLRLLRDGYRLSDKECRNEVAIVLTLIINFPAASPYFVQSGVLITFVTYACVAEAGRRAWPFFPRPLAKSRNFANNFDIDIQFKQILWMAISDILDLNDSEALLIVASSPLIPVLLSYLEHDSLDPVKGNNSVLHEGGVGGSLAHNNSNSSNVLNKSIESSTSTVSNNNNNNNLSPKSHQMSIGGAGFTTNSLALTGTVGSTGNAFISTLSHPQLREMQTYAVKFLAKNVCKMVGEFIRINGISRVLECTIRYYNSPLPEHKSMIYHSILLFNRSVLGSNIVKKILTNDDCIAVCLFLLEYSEEDATRAVAARLISILCSGNDGIYRICQEQLRIHNGIRILVNAMNAYSLKRKPLVGKKSRIAILSKGDGNFEDPCEDFRSGDIPVLIVAVLDCMKSGIVGHEQNENCLADEEGIDKLLELLEVSPFVLRTPVLRLLSDLLDNSLLKAVLQAWRSRKTLRSSAQILAHCWLDEEFRLDATREMGVLANLTDPLGNHSWPIDPRIPKLINELATLNSSTTGGDPSSRSLIVSKLAAAIAEGRNVALGSVPLYIRGQVLEKDVRVILASIFTQIGVFLDSGNDNSNDPANATGMLSVLEEEEGDNTFNNNSNEDDRSAGSEMSQEPFISSSGESRLSPSDYQVLAMAQRYLILREGAWWKQVLAQLQQNGILPIEADAALIESRLEKAFDATVSAQLEQMELQAEELRIKQAEEKGFNDQIITQKNHQIKTEWLKRNRKNKATAAAHTKKVY